MGLEISLTQNANCMRVFDNSKTKKKENESVLYESLHRVVVEFGGAAGR